MENRIEYRCHFRAEGGRKKLVKGRAPTPRPEPERPAEIPQITKLLALAHYYQRLLDNGEVGDYAEIAGLTGISRARVTQVMNLTTLAPEIQKALLCNPLSSRKKTERSIRDIAGMVSWRDQMRVWGC